MTAETSDISVALDVEQLDLNLYRSRNLSLPHGARGVFGGRLISQALLVATKCVKPDFLLHSLHAYFLISASASVPLLYYVDRLREGRSYATRSVRAMQGGQTVFVMLCSFHVPEIWQPSRHWPMPHAPRPEDCEDDVERVRRMANQPDLTEDVRALILGHAKNREESPFYIKRAGVIANESEGRSTYVYWIKTKTAKQYPAAFQKCILAYISDYHLLTTAASTAGLRRGASPEPENLVMLSSLDHSLLFYNNDFDCSDWLLYAVSAITFNVRAETMRKTQITSPAAGMGRAAASGLLYSADGTLLATVNQEGVVRVDIHRPAEVTAQVKAKM